MLTSYSIVSPSAKTKTVMQLNIYDLNENCVFFASNYDHFYSSKYEWISSKKFNHNNDIICHYLKFNQNKTIKNYKYRYNSIGKVISKKSSSGETWLYRYGKNYLITKHKSTKKPDCDRMFVYEEYDLYGRVVCEKTYFKRKSINKNKAILSSSVENKYDRDGNLIFSGDKKDSVYFEYDKYRNVIKETRYTLYYKKEIKYEYVYREKKIIYKNSTAIYDYNSDKIGDSFPDGIIAPHKPAKKVELEETASKYDESGRIIYEKKENGSEYFYKYKISYF